MDFDSTSSTWLKTYLNEILAEEKSQMYICLARVPFAPKRFTVKQVGSGWETSTFFIVKMWPEDRLNIMPRSTTSL